MSSLTPSNVPVVTCSYVTMTLGRSSWFGSCDTPVDLGPCPSLRRPPRGFGLQEPSAPKGLEWAGQQAGNSPHRFEALGSFALAVGGSAGFCVCDLLIE